MSTPAGPTGPEYLESGTGRPVRAERRGDNRRRLLLLGGLAGALALSGAAAWAATAFLTTGDQPAEALPAGTIGYASVDLDPSGSQKVEAISMLRKFPAFEDKIGLETDDDIRERIFTEAVDSGRCEGLDYGTDVEPWLGNRAAVAAVDTGEDRPTPVVVVQVTDAAGAEEGLATLAESCGDGAQGGGWRVEGDWAVLAETEEIAAQVVEATAQGSLADDAAYQQWTAAVGEPGIVTMFLAPTLGEYAGVLEGLGSPLDAVPGEMAPPEGELARALQEFGGAAATLRFDDGALELEAAGEGGADAARLGAATTGGDVIATLPQDTVAALGLGFTDGWFTALAQRAADAVGETSGEELLAELSAASGLDLPADAETLLGEAAAISLGSGLDPETFLSGGPESVPVGLKVRGDAAAIETVLDKLRPQLGPQGALLETESEGDVVAISPNPGYRADLVADGGLGDTAAYRDVVADRDAAGVLFVNFDADDGWLATLAEDDPEFAENLEPLAALGVTSWLEGEASHALVRLATD